MDYIEEAQTIASSIANKIQAGNFEFKQEIERFENLSKEMILDEGGSSIACKAVQILFCIKDENSDSFYEEKFVKYFKHAIEIYLKPWQVLLTKMTVDKAPIHKTINVEGFEYSIAKAYDEYFSKDSQQTRLAVKLIDI